MVRVLQGTDANCTDELCCWLKPGCEATTPGVEGATAGFVTQPPGPPAPDAITGYHVVVTSSPGNNDTLALYRVDDPASAPGTLLATFNLSSLENGLVLGAWNVIRVLMEDSADGTSTAISVFFNPMFPETGFVGNGTADAAKVPLPLPPRIAVVDRATPLLAPGGMAVTAGGSAARLDYVSALPASVF